MTTVYLVRHAKSIGNTERIFQGRSNLGLSAEGRAQLPQLAERFRNIPLEADPNRGRSERNLRWGVGAETFFRFTDTISRALAPLV